MYLRRIAMADFVEEVYWSAFEAAMLLPEDQWPKRQAELLAAWELRPQRLEALHALCRELNSRSLHHAAYRLSDGVFATCDDIVFTKPWVADWGMTFEHHVAAYWVTGTDECRDLGLALLARTDLPPDVRTAVERNLEHCERKAA